MDTEAARERLRTEDARDRRAMWAMWIGVWGVAALLVAAGAFVGKREHRRWEAFKTSNDCRKVAVVKGGASIAPTVGVGVGANGAVGTVVGTAITFDDDKTAWLCNDGVTYWR